MTVTNDLSDKYLNYLESMDESWYTAIGYDTGMDLLNNLYTEVDMSDDKDAVYSVSTLKTYYTTKLAEQDEKYASLAPMVDYLGAIYGKIPGTTDMSNTTAADYVLSQYDVVGENSRFPAKYNEAVLVLGANNDITDLTLTQLGLLSEDEFLSLFPQMSEETIKKEETEEGKEEEKDGKKEEAEENKQQS